MFLCRAGRRLSAAAPDRVFHAKSPGSSLAHVNAKGPRRASLTLRGGHAFRLRRTPCASAGAPVAHLEELQPAPHPARSRGGQTGFVIARWRRLDRVVPGAATPRRSVPSEGGGADVIGPPLVRAGGLYIGGTPRGDVLFTGSLGVSGRRCSTGTMHVRASSTDAKKSVGGGEGERTTDGGKRDEQNLKEALATSSSTEKTQGDPEPEGGKPNKTQQLKKIFKEYGAVGVSFHIGISLMSLGMFYLLISSGMDMAAVLCKLGFSEAVVRSKMAAGTSTFVLAYAIHKLFAPVRISITLVSVPLIVRYFRKTGLFKPPTPAP